MLQARRHTVSVTQYCHRRCVTQWGNSTRPHGGEGGGLWTFRYNWTEQLEDHQKSRTSFFLIVVESRHGVFPHYPLWTVFIMCFLSHEDPSLDTLAPLIARDVFFLLSILRKVLKDILLLHYLLISVDMRICMWVFKGCRLERTHHIRLTPL